MILETVFFVRIHSREFVPPATRIFVTFHLETVGNFPVIEVSDKETMRIVFPVLIFFVKHKCDFLSGDVDSVLRSGRHCRHLHIRRLELTAFVLYTEEKVRLGLLCSTGIANNDSNFCERLVIIHSKPLADSRLNRKFPYISNFGLLPEAFFDIHIPVGLHVFPLEVHHSNVGIKLVIVTGERIFSAGLEVERARLVSRETERVAAQSRLKIVDIEDCRRIDRFRRIVLRSAGKEQGQRRRCKKKEIFFHFQAVFVLEALPTAFVHSRDRKREEVL